MRYFEKNSEMKLVKIELEVSQSGAESLVPLLEELKRMGSIGSSRGIKIIDWDGKDKFSWDGDGADGIYKLKVFK